MELAHIRGAVLTTALLATLTTVAGGTGQAQVWTKSPGQHATRATATAPTDCLDYYGTNLNEFLTIQEQIIGHSGCREVSAGERWVLSFPGWRTAADGKKAVYPDGYRPAFRRNVPPMLDFQAKFRGARVVLDNGAEKRSFAFGPEVLQGIVRGDEFERTAFASRPLPPLPSGKYKITVFLRMSHEHYDGLGRAPQANRLPPGEFRLPDFPFEVIARQNSPRA